MANNANAKKAAAAPKEKNPNKGFVHGVKEICRKFIVMLKRRPSYIPLAVFVIAFLVYSFHLSDVSDTTALLGGANMGLAGFATMLLSMLSLLCCMNAFPYRKKTNIPMLVIMLVMIAIIIFADVYYLGQIDLKINDPSTNIDLTKNYFIIFAQYYLQQHIILLAVGVVLTALLPVYSKLLRKINTNVNVEGNGQMKAIDLTAE